VENPVLDRVVPDGVLAGEPVHHLGQLPQVLFKQHQKRARWVSRIAASNLLKRRCEHETGQNPPTHRDVAHRCAVDPGGLGRVDLAAGAGIGSMLDTGGPRFERRFCRDQYPADLPVDCVFNAVILISWARYQQRRGRQFARRRAEAKALSDKNLSESFSLAEGELEQLRRPGVLVIHNDEEGHVSEVKPISPAMWKNRG
jgi:hypothetical protein